jgi:hypothetical protein
MLHAVRACAIELAGALMCWTLSFHVGDTYRTIEFREMVAADGQIWQSVVRTARDETLCCLRWFAAYF